MVAEKFCGKTQEYRHFTPEIDRVILLGLNISIIELLIAPHKSKGHLHDPCHFSDSRESSSDENTIEGCIPECNPVVINLWEEASPRALKYVRATQHLHPPDIFVHVFGTLDLVWVQQDSSVNDDVYTRDDAKS